ncbi:MAG: hypothetical protein ABI422_02895 [Sphingomicrobium sp.]
MRSKKSASQSKLAEPSLLWHSAAMMHRRLASGVKIAVAIMGSGLMISCAPRATGEDNTGAVNTQNEVEKKPIVLPLPEPPMDREQVLLAALRAATAQALGNDDAEVQSKLAGSRFQFRTRFGCGGGAQPNPGTQPKPGAQPDLGTWQYNQDKSVLRVKVTPNLGPEHLLEKPYLDQGFESMWGITVARPWLLAAGCPAQPLAAAMPQQQPTIEIAQLFTKDDSRIQRPAATYELVKQTELEDVPTKGLDLVISGRLSALADGRVIHCTDTGDAPACLISVKIDTVSIENPVTGTELGDWGGR